MDEKENKNETKSETSLLIKKLDGTEMSMEESNRFLMIREEWKTRYIMLPADLPPQETFIYILISMEQLNGLIP